MQFEQIRNIFDPDLLQHIQFFDLIRLCQTSKSWQNICHDRYTWIFLIKRDFIYSPEEGFEEENRFIEQNVLSETRKISPKDFYEFNYVVNFKYLDEKTSDPSLNRLRIQYIVNKLKRFSRNKPFNPQTWLYHCDETFPSNDYVHFYGTNKPINSFIYQPDDYKPLLVTGFNKYDIIYKYLLNVVLPDNENKPDDRIFLHFEAHFNKHAPNVNTFPEFFDQLANSFFRGIRIDNSPQY